MPRYRPGITGNLAHQDSSSSGVSQESAGTWTTKLERVADPVQEGRYRAYWYTELRITGGVVGEYCDVRVKIDGVNVGEHAFDQAIWQGYAGWYMLDLEEDDTPTILIEFRKAGVGGATAEVRRARVAYELVGAKGVT